MNNIASRLKELREKNGLTRKEVADKLRAFGIDISDKTLYGYESGRNSANADMFLALCQIYKCNNIMDAFSDTVDDVLFTNAEWEHLEKYRFISEKDNNGKILIDSTMEYLYDRIKSSQDQIARIAELEASQEQSATIIDYHALQNTRHLYTYLQKIACAGTGFYFEDIPTMVIEAPFMRGADFVIGVNGDSMEPTYHDGDKLYVQKVESLSLGDEGIFTVRGECFVKELGECGLVSRNPEYDDIPGTEDVRLIGRVLGKVEEN